MDILNYLQPDNPIARVIVYVLGFIFVFWLAMLIYRCIALTRRRKIVDQCGKIDPLSEDLRRIVGQTPEEEEEQKKKKRGRKKKKEEDEAGKQLVWEERLQEGKEAFDRFCSGKRIPKHGILARHINAIFDAGLQDSRLDVGELLKHTNNELFKGNAFLKSLLASFIVLGLLGTLVGLADSLAGLTPVLGKETVDRTSADLATGLSLLFRHLKSAFAPSIWGVSFTVVGVILFSMYLHLVCHPLKNMIERFTLILWVPRLHFTTSQRLLGTLKTSEEQIQKNLDKISDVVKAGATIKDNAVALSENLSGSNETLVAMIKSADSIKGFTDGFAKGVSSFSTEVTKLSSFHTDLQNLYQQINSESKTFQDQIQNQIKVSIDRSQEFRDEASKAFEHQNEQLQESYKNLKSYETAYIEDRQRLDVEFQKLLEAAQNAYNSLKERNEDVLTALGQPITKILDDIVGTLAAGLQEINRSFVKFDAPINKAAEKVDTSVTNFDKRTTQVINELRQQSSDQKEELEKALNHLFERVEKYSGQLSDTNVSHTEHSKNLGEYVSALAGKIEALDSSFKSFDQFTTSEKEKINKHMVELTKDLRKEFSQQNKELNKGIDKLFKRFGSYDDELVEIRRGQSEYAKTLEKNLSGLTKAVDTLGGGISGLEKVFQKRDESLDKLQALGGLSIQMGTLVQQLQNSSLMQEKQNQLMAGNMGKMADAVRLLYQGIQGMSEKANTELPPNINIPAGNEADWNPRPRKRDHFDFAHSPIIKPIIKFCKRLIGKKY